MNKCISIWCITLITIICILCNTKYVQAVDINDLEQQRAELRDKIKKAGENLEEIDVNLTENLEEISKLDQEIYAYEETIKKISSNLENTEKQIKQIESKLDGLEKQYEYQKKLLQKRLVVWYEAGKTQYLDVLLNAKSMTDFISKYYLISEVAEYDKTLLTRIEKQKTQIEQIEISLKTSRDNQKIIKTEQKKLAISLENAKAVRSSYANKLSKYETELKEKLDTYQAQLDLVELEILMEALKDSSLEYVGGEFAWPAPGYYTITSRYGMRIHPVIKTYSKHSGMDIGAPTGAYAIAANDGIVIKATYSYSYGNMVMIDHGGGVKTLYAHASELLVNVGDVVKRGDAILKVGSTGWSTGPHLHFEIIINGTTIDPYPYVIQSRNSN